MKVVIKPRAQKSIEKIANYISKKGYPETAIKFVDRLEEFINALPSFPEKHQISRHKAFAKKSFRQVPFAKNYVIIYKEVDNVLYVYNVIHASRIR
ncbi:MAG: type II toxin-antitoxin system RelE/ParE family toxin [Bacteroidales bacterium]